MKKILKETKNEIGPDDSLDAQVLAFFTKADRLAIKDSGARSPFTLTGIDETLKRKTMRNLFEADEESDEPQFSVETFASEVARLIDNPVTLLDMKQVIVTMAKNYVKNTYNEETSLKLEEVLEEEYDYGEESGKQSEQPGSNFAVGARTATA